LISRAPQPHGERREYEKMKNENLLISLIILGILICISGMAGDVYSSCEEVELFLDGNSQEKMKTNRKTRFTALYKVRYQQGTLRIIKADGQDLCYVTVEIQDSKGLRNPTAGNLVKFEIDGPGNENPFF